MNTLSKSRRAGNIGEEERTQNSFPCMAITSFVKTKIWRWLGHIQHTKNWRYQDYKVGVEEKGGSTEVELDGGGKAESEKKDTKQG